MENTNSNQMNNTEHTHWLPLSWWFGYISIGSFLFLIGFGTLIVDAQDIFSNGIGVLYVIMLIALLLPMSIILIARPFLTKVVIKPNGLEYHSTFFVLQVDWKNLENIGYIRNTNAGKTLVLVPREGNLIYRKWAKPFPILQNVFREYPKNVQDAHILVSQFRASNGHSLETDILVNVSQIADSNESLESL